MSAEHEKKRKKAGGNLQNTDAVINELRSHIGKLKNRLEQERLNHESTKAILKEEEKVLRQQLSELETKLKSDNLRLENVNKELCKSTQAQRQRNILSLENNWS